MTADDSAPGVPPTDPSTPGAVIGGVPGTTKESPGKAARRKASRAAGPAAGANETSTATSDATRAETPRTSARATRPVVAPRRRAPHRVLVASIGLGVLAFVVAVVGGLTVFLAHRDDAETAAAARSQRFVDTATQTVVNMFSYDQNTIDDSVNRFVNGTSGPLRDMLSQGQNVENLKAIFRDTNASSETVISGAALERIDETAKNGSVIVSARVTVTDIDGVNKPSQPYRLRIVVHEDDNGHMTGYDLKYPDGGN